MASATLQNTIGGRLYALLERVYPSYLFFMLWGVLRLRLDTWRGVTMGQEGPNDYFNLLYSLLLVVSTLLVTFPYLRGIVRSLSKIKLFTAMYGFAFLSILWSISPVATRRLGIYLFCYLIGTVYLSHRYKHVELMKMFSNTSFVMALMSIVGQFVLPPPVGSSDVPGWTGLFGQKNGLGMAMAIGVLSGIAAKGQGRWTVYRGFNVAICGAVLFLSQSFTSLLCTVVGIFIFIVATLARKVSLFLLATALFFIGIAYIAVPPPGLIGLLFGLGGKDTSFTGRDIIWAFALENIAKRPFFGFGYAAFWDYAYDAAIQTIGWMPGSAHNGYLDQVLNLGLVGLLFVLGVIASAYLLTRRVRGLGEAPAATWLLVYTMVLVVHNVSEADFLLEENVTWFIFTLAYLSCARIVELHPSSSSGSDAAGDLNDEQIMRISEEGHLLQPVDAESDLVGIRKEAICILPA